MFRDIGKPVKDIFEDDFIFGQKIKFKTMNSSGIILTGESEFSRHKTPLASVSVSRPGSVFSLDKLRVKSDGRVLTELSLNTSPDSKFTMSTEDGRQEPGKPLQSFGKLGLEVKVPTLHADANIDVVNGPLLYTSLLYIHGKFKIGGEALINTHAEDSDRSPSLSDLNVGMEYVGADWSMTGRTINMFENLKLSYLHHVSPKLVLATQVNYNLKSNSQKLAFASTYELEPGKSLVKAKFDSHAILAGSFTQRLSDFVKLSLSSEVNIHDWSPNSHRFGIGLTFE